MSFHTGDGTVKVVPLTRDPKTLSTDELLSSALFPPRYYFTFFSPRFLNHDK